MNRRRLSLFCALLCLCLSSMLLAQPTGHCAGTGQVQQWYDREFHRLTGQFLKSQSPSNSGAPSQAALLERIYDLRETVSDSEAIDTFVQTASENKVLSPLARAEAAFLAIQSALHHGNFQRIESRYSILGYLRNWRITEDDFPIDAPAAHWKEFATGPTPWIEIGPDLWPENRYVTLETPVEATQEQPAVFRFSS